MEEKFADQHAISCQVLLKISNVFETLFPNVFAHEARRQFLFCQKFGMHANDEYLLVVTAVKNSDVAAVRKVFHAAPEIIVVQILGRRRLEGIDLTTLWIYAGHDMLDGAVFARGVHCLKNQEQRPLVLSIQFIL